jgi:hypothetical protein
LIFAVGGGRALAQHDIVVPAWATLHLEAQDSLVLFGYSVRACQEGLSL